MVRIAVSKVSLVLFVLVLGLLAVSVLTTSVSWIEPTDLGLASKLPLSYWVGFCLLGVLWFVGRKSRFSLIMALVLTFCYLYVGPAVIRATPWISNSYYPFGEALLINQNGHLQPRSSALFVSYHDWPIFLYFASALTLVTGISHELLVRVFPLFMVSMYGLFSVLILRTKLRLRYALIGAGWVLASLFIKQQYFGPPSVAYLFFLFIMLLSALIFFDDKKNKRVLIPLLIFLCIITTITHALTSLMSIFLVVAVYLSYRFVIRKSSSTLTTLPFFLVVVWVSYNMFLAGPFFNTTIAHMSAILFGERDLNLYSEPSRIVGSQAMQVNYFSSWGIVFLVGGICLLSILLMVRTWRKNPLDSKLGFSFFMVFMIVLFGLFGVGGEYGAHESYQRAFMFALVPLSFLCVTLLKKKPALLVVCLVGLLFLNIPAQYGSDTYRLTTRTQLAGAKFISDQSGDNVTLIGKFSNYVRYYNATKDVKVLGIGLDFPFTVYNATEVQEVFTSRLDEVDFVIWSDLQSNYFEYFLGLDPLDDVEVEANCDRIYDNGGFRLYVPQE